MSFSDKTTPDFDRSRDDYEKWKRKFGVWQTITEQPKGKQGGLLILKLDDTTQDEVLEQITDDEIKGDDGVKKITDILDKMFKKDASVTAFENYEHFETLTRPDHGCIIKHCDEFHRRYQKVKSSGTTLSEPVLAYRLLRSANLNEEAIRLIRTTISKITYDEMLKQLKKAFNKGVTFSSGVSVKIEPDYVENETLYGAAGKRYTAWKNAPHKRYDSNATNYDRSGRNPYNDDHAGYDRINQRYNPSDYYYPKNQQNQRVNETNSKGPRIDKQKQRKVRGRNPLDMYGNITRCQLCESINHWKENCPDKELRTYLEGDQFEDYKENNRDQDEENLTYEISHAVAIENDDFNDNTFLTLTCDTFNVAILDSGAPKSVGGEKWLNNYLNTLSQKDKESVTYEHSNNYYKFGSGSKIKAKRNVTIPAIVGDKSIKIKMDIIDGEIPLLLSREFMKKTNSELNFKNDTIDILEQKVNLIITESGHYGLPLGRNRQVITDAERNSDLKLTLHVRNMNKKEIALKLHRQFSHPTAERLIQLVKNQSENCDELVNEIKEVTASCKICMEYRKTPPRPIVGLPLATRFGQVVAMDLKQFGNVHLLHMIDHATRLSGGCIVRSKSPNVIVRQIFQFWISIYGTPEAFLCDNGGEFNNSTYQELAEKLNITIKTTAAESAWSNGLVERHNGVLGEMIKKTQSDSGCTLEMAIAWCLNAHNSLSNVHGFSPFQLVLGKNPSLPCLATDKPPALNDETTSDIIRKNLNAMHAARQAHIKCESDSKIRRALSHNVRTSGDTVYVTGDKVYFKRVDSKKWQGPGVVLGQHGQQVLVKNGGTYIRVHPCRLTLVKQTIVGFKEPQNKSPNESNNPMTKPSTYKDSDTDEYEHQTEDLAQRNERNCVQHQENINQTEENDVEPTNSDEEEFLEVESDMRPEVNLNNTAMQQTNPQSVLDTELTHGESSDQKRQLCSESKSLKPGVMVKFKNPGENNWKTTKLVSRAAKKGGKYDGEWNTINANDERQVINFDKDVPDWQIIQQEKVEVNYTLSCNEATQIEVYLAQSFIKENKEQIQAAKIRELESWTKNMVYEEVEDQNQYCISGRWVVKPKMIDNKQSVKARYVLRGFEEETKFRTDSPTCQRESVRFALSVFATQKWKLHSIDFKTAFLLGDPIERDVFVKPPKEACTTKIWKLKKTVYGLKDAPRKWYLRLKQSILNRGCKLSSIDNGMFLMHVEGELIGMLVIFVDDVLWGGTHVFKEKVISKLKSELEVGSEKDSAFEYIGISMVQNEDYSIVINQKQYIDSILEMIELTRDRESQKNSLISSTERKLLKSAVGRLNWVSGITRPDISFMVGTVCTGRKATVEDLIKTNKIIKHVKSTPTDILFPQLIDLKQAHIKVYTDASYQNCSDGGSQGGHVVFITDGTKSSPVAWHSKKVQRIVHSTLAAETLALVEGCETAYMEARRLAEIITGNPNNVKPVVCVTDNNNLYTGASTSKCLTDKRLHVEMNILREMINNGELKLEWCRSSDQLSDSLTKVGASSELLREVISMGRERKGPTWKK